MDLKLREIKREHPNTPIIVLAHHSPDFFTKEEKEAVENILRGYPVKLYLCGDSHKVWWRAVNGYLEITMGCMKDGEKTEAAFLVGDTNRELYTVYHWAGAWEPYAKFNQEISEWFRKNTLEQEDFPGGKCIEREQQSMQNEVLLPWMKNSISCRAVFPKLLMEPRMVSEKLRRQVSFSGILDEYRNENLVITGGAGSGKTTFLKAMFLYRNGDNRILYLKASCMKASLSELSDYEKNVREILEGRKVKEPVLVLLDGIDEAFVDDILSSELDKLMKQIVCLERVSVWFGWRSEHYHKQETEAIRHGIVDIISVQPWEMPLVEKYVKTYAQETGQKKIIDDFKVLLDRNKAIKELVRSPFHLTLLIYLLENKEHSPEIQRYFDSKDVTLFELYQQFFECWMSEEHERGTSTLEREAIRQKLWDIAGKLYYECSCTVEEVDSAVTDLLLFSSLKYPKKAVGFWHRSFCAFFCGDKIFHSILQGGEAIIKELRIPLRNDVTDFVRSAISTITEEKKLMEIQKHMADIYRQIVEPNEKILNGATRNMIASLTRDEQFYLKNELIYLLTRISDKAGIAARLLELADKVETDSFMRLDLAYGAVLTELSGIALDYARTLVPGSDSDLVNRSWTMAYFGDVLANPYHYRDDKKDSWEKSRKVRLNRFQSKERKAIRFRILDIPLMYCFYASRDWVDVNQEDLQIIRQVDVDCSEYTEEEKLFLKEQKKKLLEEYEKHMGTSCH